MKVNYFEYEGKKYYAGTEFQIRKNPYDDPKYSEPAIFLYYDSEYDDYIYRMKFSRKVFINTSKLFFQKFCYVTKASTDSIGVPERKQLKDYQIPKLFFGWFWYVFLMSISLIFNGFIIWWALISIVFFNWRKKVIEEEGHYIEWPL